MKPFLKSPLILLAVLVMSSSGQAQNQPTLVAEATITCQAMVRPASRSQPKRDGVVNNTYQLSEVVEVDGVMVPVYTRSDCVAN